MDVSIYLDIRGGSSNFHTIILKKYFENKTYIMALGYAGGGVYEEFFGQFLTNEIFEDIGKVSNSIGPNQWENSVKLSFEEIYNLSLVTRNDKGYIIDDKHKTYPVLSKYEKAKIIGIRVNQLNYGAEPFVTVTQLNLDKVIIVEEELKQKKLPFIIKRPIPNGKFEYWNVKDLEMI